MGDTKTTLTWLLRDEVSGTAKKVNAELDKAGKTAAGQTGIFGKLGGAVGGLVNPATLALGAVGALTGGLALAIDKANAHDVVSKRLDATLAANVKGWDDNRTAIDAYIEKQTNAGFTVDETTASLAQLVTATGSVQKAQEFQAAAEDLARLKGISLADATDAMTKIEAGRFKGLANLGIVLQKGATVTDALTAVQKVAAGQSAAYGATVSGSMAKINAKLDDATTKIGDALLPAVTQLAGLFADTLLPAVEDAAAAFASAFGPAIKGAIADLGKLIGWVGDAANAIDSLFHKVDQLTGTSAKGGGTDILGSIAGALLGPGFSLTQKFGARAAGGPVAPGTAYTVGENGPETLVMGRQSGSIVPNVGGAPVHIHVDLDGRTIADVVDSHLFYALRRAGTAS